MAQSSGDHQSTTYTSYVAPRTGPECRLSCAPNGNDLIVGPGLRCRGIEADHEATCQLQKGTAVGFSLTGDEPWFWLAEGVNGQAELTSFSAHRVMPIFAADNPSEVLAGQKIMLTCDGEDGSIQATQLHITATYYPTKYDKTLTPLPGPIFP